MVQGRSLWVPELVPFRLTNDVVDGLGFTGVDGVFRRCCEETLRVLREQSVAVMTILEVLRHDPLNRWCGFIIYKKIVSFLLTCLCVDSHT